MLTSMFKPLSSINSSLQLEDTKHAISNLKRNYDASSDEEVSPPQKISKVSSSSGFQFVNMCKPNSKFFFHSGSFSSSGGGSSGTEHSNLNNLDSTDSRFQSPPMENKSEEMVPLFRGDSLENDISVGVFEALGKRQSMEDRHEVVPFANAAPSATENEEVHHEPENYAFFAIYDGHGGTAAADYVQANLHKKIISQSCFKNDPEKAIREGMRQTEQDFMDKVLKENLDGLTGTTVCVALIHGNVLYAANVGDSAIILCRHGKVLKLTNPHTPKNPAEKARVLGAGGVIVKDRLGHPHWNANLINVAVTRAFGDIYFKAREFTDGKPSGLSAEPELTKITLTFDDEFILLASDGFWDVVTPREAIEYVKERPKVDPSIICKELTDLALRRSTMDNTTVLLIRLHSNQNHVDSEKTEHKQKNDTIKS